MATTPSSWLDDAFKSAKEDFRRSLKNPALYDFSKIVQIDDVYDEARKIQSEQAKTKTLRGLKRLEPLINGLKEYSAVVEVFIQVKPDVMSLIWGPLKLILQTSSSVLFAFEKVVQVIRDIGMVLPNFKVYAELFQSNHDIRRALCLFYADILDLYAALLNFLMNRRLNVLLESVWPNIRSSIGKIQENMEQHKAMMTMGVTLEDILRADQARKLALEENGHQQAFRDCQTFSTIRKELNPQEYDTKLAEIARQSSVEPGEWLKIEPDFLRWLDAADRTLRCMWLYGIPGSGKTFLVGNLIKRMQNSGQRVLFVFLSHDNQTAGDSINVLHTILFQLLEDDSTCRSILYEASHSNYRKLKSDSGFVMDLLCEILKAVGPSFIILDGLDELDEISWKRLLSDVLQLHESCPETKLLISSREERDISLRLREKAVPLRVDHKNFEDINSFVQLKCQNLLEEMEAQGADNQMCLKVKEALSTIAENAEGRTVPDIEAEVENLPRGLDQVYGRLLARIKSKPTARIILQWIACARRPLTEEEMLQILAVKPGQLDFTEVGFTKVRKEFRDIRKECGPIIEISNDTIRFVHFSAKEYLLHEQSNKFLDLTEAHLDAALICTAYLSFFSFNTLFSSSSDEILDIRKQIVDGDYVMFEYASTEFLEHLLSSFGSRGSDVDSRLLATTIRFQETRAHDYIDISLIPKHFTYMFESFANNPELHAVLSAVMHFQRKARLGLLDNHEVTDSSTNDPLRLFLARRRFRQSLESIVCVKPNQETLKRLYGTKLYHCDQYFCHAYRNGFESPRARDQHLGIHNRSYKCPVANCLFAEIGLRNTSELQTHRETAHPSRTFEKDPIPSTSPRQPLANAYEVVRDAVMLDEVENIKWLLSLSENKTFKPWDAKEIFGLAGWKASPDTLSYLISELKYEKFSRFEPLEYTLATALETENLPNIKLLLSHGAKMSTVIQIEPRVLTRFPKKRSSSCVRDHVRYSGYIRALGLWSPDLMAYLTNECKVDLPVQIKNPEGIFEDPAIYGTNHDDARKRFSGIKQYILWPEAYKKGAWAAATNGHTLAVRICLENGGDPNAASKPDRKKESSAPIKGALYQAVKSGSRRGAEVVKVLLQYGANPNIHCGRMEKLLGMKNIEKRFGFPWKEIVQRIQAGEDLAIT
ncbi:hypothetical protein F4820DRAFT_461052 [Hypoxylon rubiginosum]|uniref:Uncharacterized protein n=1 Tax=Hypoxylon rubiginosum TaxID=110542 RepID=A0ACB9YQ23_9PEZI|nr:hypothetical protein F4820DRAFT_461052 [Hypoxylon rubiginosum]